MDLADRLRKKGFIVTVYENTGDDYRKQWREMFFESTVVGVYYRGFLWELFVRDDLVYLEGNDANKAFSRVNKQYCYIFFEESNDVLKVQYASEMKAKELLHEGGEYSDVYVVDKGFNWTYVIPHEKGIYGPYFFRK